MLKKSQGLFILIGVLLGVLSTLSVYSAWQSGIIAFIEYTIVLYLICQRNLKFAFFYFLLFICLSIEQDSFIFGMISNNANRYYFLSIPLLRSYLFYALCFYFYYKFKHSNRFLKSDIEAIKLKKWLKFLFYSGIISILFGMLINDNRIISSDNYPKVAIQQILGFIPLLLISLTSLECIKNKEIRKELSDYCQLILINISIVALITTFVFGIIGYYDRFEIMLTPISISLTPFLIVFFPKNNDSNFNLICLFLGILIIIASFIQPTCIGSKWYIILLLAFIGLWTSLIKSKSAIWIIVIFIISFSFILNFASSWLSIIDNDYVLYKLTQTLNLFDIFNYQSTASLLDLDNSTLYRFDEPYNICLEYMEKPWFLLFGKGFGGTTLHYTNLLSWELDVGSFSQDQIKLGAYYSMHETIAVIFLRHGLLGLLFIGYIIYNLINKIRVTPWSMIALVWFIFNWSYGLSTLIGAVALTLVFTSYGKKY